ncbi:hypothetical protein AKJ16_DCAP02533 [Drosera capensis]
MGESLCNRCPPSTCQNLYLVQAEGGNFNAITACFAETCSLGIHDRRLLSTCYWWDLKLRSNGTLNGETYDRLMTHGSKGCSQGLICRVRKSADLCSISNLSQSSKKLATEKPKNVVASWFFVIPLQVDGTHLMPRYRHTFGFMSTYRIALCSDRFVSYYHLSSSVLTMKELWVAERSLDDIGQG